MARDLVKLVLIAVLIASPIACYAMHTWLQGFQYRIQLSSWIFLGAGSFAIIIALATESYQAIRSAVSDPVNSLRQ